MYSSETKIRIRYAETDQMGYVYYGNYATYLEVARVEALRELGISYKVLEDEGFIMPVIEYAIRYLKPMLYDDELTIKTVIREKPRVRIRFDYECYNGKAELVSTAETTLVFLKKEDQRPCPPPKVLMEALTVYFNIE